jgi:uncharacterized membrane protein YdbT with pleckstrin-like domain
VIVPVRRIRRQELVQTVWQRRAGLARLRVAAGSGTEASVAHLELSTARTLFETLR